MRPRSIEITLASISALLLIVLIVGVWKYYALAQVLAATKTELASTTAAYQVDQETVATDTSALISAENENDSFSNQINTISTTVGTLTKLSQTDPQLLAKYSKVYFLNENYVPDALATISPSYVYDTSKTLQFEQQAYPFLEDLLNAAKVDGVDLSLASAYRSFGTQAALKAEYMVTYGSGANTFSADQGYSEHQLGTAVDFTTSSLNGGLDGFDATPAYAWLQQNAYKYGFELSYPQGNSYYIYEPWHWRFVGKSLALTLHENKENFYDMDQRTINTYLISLFDN
jgi:D-alanyl-D-alanine carboxypeptidase